MKQYFGDENLIGHFHSLLINDKNIVSTIQTELTWQQIQIWESKASSDIEQKDTRIDELIRVSSVQ